MAVLKVACPKCGQRVSGDDTFFGTTVECPVCSSTIRFPERPAAPQPSREAAGPLDLAVAASSRDPHAGLDLPPQPRQPQPESPEPARQPAHTSINLPPKPSSFPEHHEPPSPFLGVISMVLGIVSVALICLPGILFGPAAIISGHMALARSRRSSVRPVPGRGAAITGLILGYLSLLGFILITLFVGPWIVEKIRASAPPQ
ncbi:MAG: DUF4190 domain-containing protein [Verrucomicrobiae bacterium]|nr:DUF4190 domain-containing protein [Verrucomicrobiae bacterium]